MDKSPPPFSPAPQAAVVDTNLWAKGALDINRLFDLAQRLKPLGVTVWVPRQVILEWASHAANDVELARPSWNRLRKAGLVADKFPITSHPSELPSGMATRIEMEVSNIDNVNILPMHGQSAVAGIMDQILGTGAGSVRNGVKTGASDSSWVRDALEAVGNKPERVVFVTNNEKDVYATLKSLGITSPDARVKSESNLLESVAATVAASEHIRSLVATHLLRLQSGELPTLDPWEDGRTWIEISDFKIDSTIATVIKVDFQIELAETDELSINSWPEIIAIKNLLTTKTANRSNQQVTVDFLAILAADLSISSWTINGNTIIRDTPQTIPKCIVSVPLVADIIGERVANVSQAGTADFFPFRNFYRNPAEALSRIIGDMDRMAGIKIDAGADIFDDEVALMGVNGRTVRVSADGDPDDTWEIHFSIDGKSVTIACYDFEVSDEIAAREMLMGRDYAYQLVSTNPNRADNPYSAIGMVWAYLAGAQTPGYNRT